MTRSQKMIGLLVIGCLCSSVSCAKKPALNVLVGDATVECKTDCVAVSKGFVREHGQLLDEVIRTRAALKLCQEKH